MIVIGDIHGCFDTLLALLAQIPEEDKAKGICFAGDLIDRGPRSAQVIQYAIDNNIHVVKGNHEDMFQYAFQESPGGGHRTNFLLNGGQQTIRSYETYGDQKEEMLNKHLEYVKALPIYLEFKEIKDINNRYLLISHSNMDTRALSYKFQNNQAKFEEYIMWNRNSITKPIPGTFNVYGHTPQYEPRLRKTKANIDTGACYTSYGYGKLTALVFPSMKIYQQDNIEPELQRPEILKGNNFEDSLY